MVDIVAVHGAFRGGWSWNLVRPLVEAAGHRLFTPDLTGMGPDGHAADLDVTLDDWIGDVVGCCDDAGLDRLVLVGHSMGGVVCQASMGALGDRVGRLVLIDAPFIAAGERAVDVSGPPPAVLPPRTTWLPPTPVGEQQGFVDPELAAWVNDRLRDTPLGPQLDPCPAPPPLLPPTTIAFCSRTPPGYPAVSARSRCDADGAAYRLIESHHDAPLLAPEQVAALLSCGIDEVPG